MYVCMYIYRSRALIELRLATYCNTLVPTDCSEMRYIVQSFSLWSLVIYAAGSVLLVDERNPLRKSFRICLSEEVLCEFCSTQPALLRERDQARCVTQRLR